MDDGGSLWLPRPVKNSVQLGGVLGLSLCLTIACGGDDKSESGGSGANGGSGGSLAGSGGSAAGSAGAGATDSGGSASGGSASGGFAGVGGVGGGAGGVGGAAGVGGGGTGGQLTQQGWSTPVDISTTGVGVEPKLALDGAGNATLAWGDVGAEVAVWGARYDVSAGEWGGVERIARTTNGDSMLPLVRSLPNGDALTVYVENDNPGAFGNDRLKGLLFSATTDSWSGPLTIQTEGTGRVSRWRDLVVAPTGEALAVWAQNLSLWFSTYDGQFSTPAEVAPADMSVVDDVRLTLGPMGHAHATWTMSDTDQSVRYASYDFSTAMWTTPIDIAAPSAGFRSGAEIAVDSSGDVLVIWRRVTQADPLDAEMGFASRIGGSWSEGLVSAAQGGNQLYGELVLDSADVPIAVWLRENAGQYEVLASRFTDGAWSSAAKLSAAPSEAFAHPEVAAGPGGSLFVVWEQTTGGMVDIVVNRYVEGAWQGVEPLSEAPFASIFVTHPQTDVVVDGTGVATVAWSAGGLIQGARYQP